MTESRTCSRCGAPIASSQDPTQPCARCLLQAALRVSSASSNAARVPAPAVSELQPHFPELEIVELIGEGGMGAVYRARDKTLDRTVALKILTVASDDGSFDERFAREARAMAQLSHANIAAVHSHGKAGPWSYLVMEFVEGENLRRKMRARAVTPKEALAWVGEICDALQFAHEHGVVHRDIKPENVLIDTSGRVKVVDFGLAKLLNAKPGDATLTNAQQALGTWHYMAPEQYERPRDVDHRADIYSLGVVFYELLTGQVPVGRFDLPSQTIHVDVRLDDVVLKALAREPDKRYQHASEVKSDVEHLETAPPRSTTAARGAPWLAKLVIAVGALALTLGLLGIAFALLMPVDDATGAPMAAQTGAAVAAEAPSPETARIVARRFLFMPWVVVAGAAGVIGGVWLQRYLGRRAKAGANGRSASIVAWVVGSILLLFLFCGCAGALLLAGRSRSATTIEAPK